MQSHGQFVDDKSPHVIPFVLERLQVHLNSHSAGDLKDAKAPPFFLGMNGVQGAGKTTLVSNIAKTLGSPPHSFPTVILSIDDLYLPHDSLLSLAASHPANPLLQHRGQFSTHDVPLGLKVFESLRRGQETRIPSFDKSAHQGKGDREDAANWLVVNQGRKEGEKESKANGRIDVVILEGWCVGFRALGKETVTKKWMDAVRERDRDPERYQGRLAYVDLQNVLDIDKALEQYDHLTE
ncbi:hypothetical protein MMC09_000833 [Bachmanniomyces sp. S44760]|nr:hypothetical protein [Bachmanniomyces sp. S44760]